ncbi:MAG TPA: glycerophosphodiester phosphodiesterase family protein [Chloroflexota bacterium]|nr:glycerophosphodiester phosphodiesterase family protein [Chloroflexota bacterium]
MTRASSSRSELTWLRRQPASPPIVVAHRGASGEAPENTLAAFRLAVEQGAQYVECDVHLSSDGVPVVIHDEKVDRTTNGTGEVARMTLAELRALDAGGWLRPEFGGEKLPTLDEALAACAGKARMFVELKRGGGEALVEASLAAIERGRCEVAVISFGPEEVRALAARRPDLPLGFLIGRATLAQHGLERALAAARERGASFFSPQQDAVDAGVIEAAHAAGMPVSVWTVDDAARMTGLAGAGVDAITTNLPALALRTLA